MTSDIYRLQKEWENRQLYRAEIRGVESVAEWSTKKL